MGRVTLIFALFSLLASCSVRPEEPGPGGQQGWLKAPPLQAITVNDSFWKPLIERNRTVTIPYAFEMCEETGRIDNFAIAGGLMKGRHTGERYNDSDLFKIIEGACYSLIVTPDPLLRSYVDSLVTLIAAAQEDDGYLYTTRTIDPHNMAPGAGRERWIDERVSHELYNAGHMYEAAVAHHMATGTDTFLKVALKNAELVASEFGWGRREIAPGHQEIETGLIRLYELTGDERWLKQAQFFIDVRGRHEPYLRHPAGSRFEVYNDSLYLQMHLPVLGQREAVGHAVRGAYMFTAMADLSRVTGDTSYLRASERLWDDVAGGKIYITGGIGSKEHGEAFGTPFELPNMTAYTETCASVANVFWNHRLYHASGDSRYLDVLERTLYNGLISGIGQDGCSFYYPNPLESDGRFERAGWFDCSCCPGNIARFMPAMQHYIWSETETGINLNLFIGSVAQLTTPSGNTEITTETDYPWGGEVKITVNPENPDSRFTMGIRVPAWTGDNPMEGGLYSYITPAKGKVTITVNGKRVRTPVVKGFAMIERKWGRGDRVEIVLPMEPRFIVAREEVEADKGRVALGYGPMVFCLEEADNGPVRELTVNPSVTPLFAFEQSLLGGVGTLTFPAATPLTDPAATPLTDPTDPAAATPVNREVSAHTIPAAGSPAATTGDTHGKMEVKAVPYYSWANRGRGEMTVWIKINK